LVVMVSTVHVLLRIGYPCGNHTIRDTIGGFNHAFCVPHAPPKFNSPGSRTAVLPASLEVDVEQTPRLPRVLLYCNGIGLDRWLVRLGIRTLLNAEMIFSHPHCIRIKHRFPRLKIKFPSVPRAAQNLAIAFETEFAW